MSEARADGGNEAERPEPGTPGRALTGRPGQIELKEIAPPPAPSPPKRSFAKRLGRITLMAVGPLALAIAGGAYMVATAPYVTTENAYLKAEKIAISPDVSGHVAEVSVRENDVVSPGQLLFRLDRSRFRIALGQARAALHSARQEVATLRALYRQKTAELSSAREEILYYDGEYERFEKLEKQGHISRTQFEEARRDRMMARHSLEAVQQDIEGVLAKLGGDPGLPTDQHPKVQAALNELEQAGLDLSRTAVIAPLKAVVSNISLQAGEYVELGKPVFSLVDAENLWIEANLKETDLTHVRPGQLAEVTVDAYPDFRWQARVSGIAPATGAEFALLPPQNASGNWVKVVQRVPVRLIIERQAGEPPLRAGMSVQVEIDTGVEMDLPEPLRAALAWVVPERTPPSDR